MNCKVHFINGNSKHIEQHYLQKEYRNDVIVELDGFYFEVYFFTEKSIEYEMLNSGYFSMPGIIILTEISNEKIITAIKELRKLNFFESFKGKTEIPLNSRFIQKWYENDMNTFTMEDISSLDLEDKK